MKKIYYVAPLTLVTALSLSACGKEKDVLTETQEAMKAVKGMEVETSLTWDINTKEDEAELQAVTIKADVQEERDQASNMHRMLNYDTSEGAYSEEQYVTEEGIMYADVEDQWVLLEDTIYKQDIGAFDTQAAYINVEGVLSEMLGAVEASSDHVDYKEDGDTYVLTLASVHEKVKDADKLFKDDIGADLTTDFSVYDIEIVVDQKTSFVEKVIIDMEMETKQDNIVSEEIIKIEGQFSEADVNIQVPQEVLDEAVSF